MAKSKKLTFNMINEILPDIEETEVVIDEEHGYVLGVKHMLGFSEAMNFVRSVASGCFDGGDRYMPEVFDFAVAINVMMYYAGMDAPKDFEKAYRVLMMSDVYSMVLSAIDKGQLEALIDAARRLINHRREEIIQTNIGKMNELIGEVGRMVEDSHATAEAINSGEFQRTMESLLHTIGGNQDTANEGASDASQGGQPDNIVPLKPEG